MRYNNFNIKREILIMQIEEDKNKINKIKEVINKKYFRVISIIE
jgi:hypothetical protein